MHCMHVPLYYLSGCTEPAAHGLGAYAAAAAAALMRRAAHAARASPLGGARWAKRGALCSQQATVTFLLLLLFFN